MYTHCSRGKLQATTNLCELVAMHCVSAASATFKLIPTQIVVCGTYGAQGRLRCSRKLLQGF